MSDSREDFKRHASINGTGIIIPRFSKRPSTPSVCEGLKKRIDHLTMMLDVGEYHPRPDSLFWRLHTAHRDFSLSTERSWHSFWYEYRGCEEINNLKLQIKKIKDE